MSRICVQSEQQKCYVLNYQHFVNSLSTFFWNNSIKGNEFHGLWKPEAQCRIHQGFQIIPILSRINPISISLKPIPILYSHLRQGLPKCPNKYLHGLRNPEVQCRIQKNSPIILILSRINPIPRIDTNLFKVHSNIALPSTPWPPQRSLSCRFTLTPLHITIHWKYTFRPFIFHKRCWAQILTIFPRPFCFCSL